MRASGIWLIFLGVAAGCTTVEQEPFEESVARIVSTGEVEPTVEELALPLIESGRNIGMVIAVSTPQAEGIFAYGSEDPEGQIPLKQDAKFQIGSISKSFTAVLAAELEAEQRLKLDAPIGALLPPSLQVASTDLKKITPSELLSHTSGMPHEGYTLDLLWGVVSYLATGKNLYRFYTTATLEDYVQTYKFEAPAKKVYAYSNIGFTYLGWALGQVDHKGFGHLLREKVLDPLGLSNTGLCLADNGGAFLTPGYAGDLPTFVSRDTRVDPWLFDEGISGAGGLYSTAGDLLRYAKANLGAMSPASSPLVKALAKSHVPLAPAEDGQIGLGWFVKTLPQTQEPYTYIAGIVGGHTSFVGFDAKRQVAVVVLENSINHDDMIGVTLLDRLAAAQYSK